jgi:hypothetical protein
MVFPLYRTSSCLPCTMLGSGPAGRQGPRPEGRGLRGTFRSDSWRNNLELLGKSLLLWFFTNENGSFEKTYLNCHELLCNFNN